MAITKTMYFMKRVLSYVLMAIIPFLAFLLVWLITNNLLYSSAAFIILGGILFFFSMWLTSHPMLTALEDSSKIWVDAFDSTGNSTPFLAEVVPPYIQGKVNGKLERTIYNRQLVSYFETPRDAGYVGEINGNVVLSLPKDQYARYRFKIEQIPRLIFNKQMGIFTNKDIVNDKEVSYMANEHELGDIKNSLFIMIEKLESLDREILKKIFEALGKGNMKWILILLLGMGLIVLGYFLWPSISSALGLAGKGVAEAGANKIITSR